MAYPDSIGMYHSHHCCSLYTIHTSSFWTLHAADSKTLAYCTFVSSRPAGMVFFLFNCGPWNVIRSTQGNLNSAVVKWMVCKQCMSVYYTSFLSSFFCSWTCSSLVGCLKVKVTRSQLAKLCEYE